MTKIIPKKKKCKKAKWLSEEALQIAEKRKDMKGKGTSHPQCGLAKSMPVPGTSLSTESHTGSPWQRAQEETPGLPLQTHLFLNPVSAFVQLPCARPCSGPRDEARNQSGEFPLFGGQAFQ